MKLSKTNNFIRLRLHPRPRGARFYAQPYKYFNKLVELDEQSKTELGDRFEILKMRSSAAGEGDES